MDLRFGRRRAGLSGEVFGSCHEDCAAHGIATHDKPGIKLRAPRYASTALTASAPMR